MIEKFNLKETVESIKTSILNKITWIIGTTIGIGIMIPLRIAQKIKDILKTNNRR